jgi:xylan 1,4-beta-xylosidase
LINPSSYRNPVIPGFHADPSLCRVGADYYLVTSSFEYFPGVPLFHSRDLIHWRQIGHCLTRSSQLPLTGCASSAGIFAPTLRYHAGVFYLITTNVSGGGNFYVTARDPAGPWSEPVWLRETTGGIDPSLFFDDDGRIYFTRQGGGERGGIFQSELDLERGQLVGEARPIWTGTGGIWPEGPHLYKIAGRYYLLISEGGTGYGHSLTIARSDSPWGPFEPCPRNPILTHSTRPEHPIQATGHADLVQTQAGAFWLALLGIRPTDGKHHHLGRETFLAPLIWDSEGWPVIGGGAGIELEMSGTGLPPAEPLPKPHPRDDFDARTLGPDWNLLRNPSSAAWSLSERSGWLRLWGNAASLDDLASPGFVGRRQQHFRCTVSTLLELESARGDCEAGLCVRANEANHYDLVVVVADGQRSLRLRARRLGVSELIAETALEPGPIVLSIRAQPSSYEFFWALPGAEPQSLGTLPTDALSTEVVGGFTGVFFGMYARAAAEPVHADFDWFACEPGE